MLNATINLENKMLPSALNVIYKFVSLQLLVNAYFILQGFDYAGICPG